MKAVSGFVSLNTLNLLKIYVCKLCQVQFKNICFNFLKNLQKPSHIMNMVKILDTNNNICINHKYIFKPRHSQIYYSLLNTTSSDIIHISFHQIGLKTYSASWQWEVKISAK
jgi:hypothetical protein